MHSLNFGFSIMEKHIVIARRFRPKRFSEVVGQDHITNILKNQIKENKIPQSVIFAGQRGLGKTTTARIFSKAINCLNLQEDSEPCNKCDICTLINMQSLVDVIEIDGASNRGINEVRILRENALYSPVQARYKVYIIDEVHMLTREAFNALLKILEEPPSHVVFLMATTEPDRIPVTIKSRCQVHYFKEITHGDMEKRLGQIISTESRKIDEEGLSYIINFAKGSMRDAESILEKVLSSTSGFVPSEEIKDILGIFDAGVISDIFKAIYNNDCAGIIDIFVSLKQESTNYILLYEMLIDHYSNLIRQKALTPDTEPGLSLNDLLFDIKILLNIEENLLKTSYKGVLLETTILHLICKGRLKDIQHIRAMLNDIGNLEAVKGIPDPEAGESQKAKSHNRGESHTSSTEGITKNPVKSKDDAKLLNNALKILEERDPLFHSLISNIEYDIRDSEIMFMPSENGNSLEILKKQESVRLFEDILSDEFKKSFKISFGKSAPRQKENDSAKKHPDLIKKDPKIRSLLETFKADIEKIE